MNVINALRRSRKVWLAIAGVAQTIIFTLIPEFPDEVWQAINVLLLVVIGSIALEDAAEKVGKNNVHILPAALEGEPSSMEGVTLSSQSPSEEFMFVNPPPSDPHVTPPPKR